LPIKNEELDKEEAVCHFMSICEALTSEEPPNEAYELYLHRTETHIAPHTTLEEAGVVDGDLIDVLLPMQGAGSTTLVEEHESDQPVELHFMHPRSSKTLTADVSPQCSGEEALAALLSNYEGPFLSPVEPGDAYELFVHRTNTYISPHTTFKQAGTIDGDLIDIKISRQRSG
jgi:hypothetical protein